MVLKTLNDIYKEKLVGEEIHEVLIKKNLIIKKDIDIKDITTVSEIYNDNGRIYKGRCVITTKTGDMYYLKHKFEEIVELKKPIEVNGFRGK